MHTKCTHTHARLYTLLKLDRNARTKDGLTPLHIAACRPPRGSCNSAETGGATDTMSISQLVIKLLLQTDEKSVRCLLLAQEHLRKRTPLHLACSRANATAVQELLNHIHGMLQISVSGIAHCVELYFCKCITYSKTDQNIGLA